MVPATRLTGGRLGLLADTHDELCDWPAVSAKIAAALHGVDGILHCGDLTSPAALDSLRKIAPVIAVRSPADPEATPPELVDGPCLIEAGELSIGLVNTLAGPPVGAVLDPVLEFPELPADQVGPELFGRPVQVVVFGGSHVPCLASAGGVLFVNPGSPSLAKSLSLGLLEVHGSVAVPHLVRLDA